VAVGNFDGVHRGHQALVASAVAQARQTGGVAVVLTFDPHPSRVLRPEAGVAPLTTLEQKEELLAGLGVDRLAVLAFDRRLAGLSPGAFAEQVLAGALGARHVVVGESFRFGHDRQGDAHALLSLGGRLGFTVDVVPPVVRGGRPVSSSRVREALRQGAVREAGELLGRPYFVDGRVVKGDGRGRTIGVPTANLEPDEQVLPARGVYAAHCRVASGRGYLAVVNVGERPTFGGGRLTVEAHLLDFSGELYASRVRLELIERLRGEERFSGAEALVARIQKDIAAARVLLPPPGGGRV
jgi:riboflavin kinase/FMN adenylyltransferase